MNPTPEEQDNAASNPRTDTVVPGATGLRAEAPLLDGYLNFLESHPTPFTTPGHKGRASLLDKDLAGWSPGRPPLRRR